MAYPPCVVMHRARARSSSREGPGFYPTMFRIQIRCMLPKGILIITDWCFLGYCLDLKLFDGTRGTRFSDTRQIRTPFSTYPRGSPGWNTTPQKRSQTTFSIQVGFPALVRPKTNSGFSPKHILYSCMASYRYDVYVCIYIYTHNIIIYYIYTYLSMYVYDMCIKKESKVGKA